MLKFSKNYCLEKKEKRVVGFICHKLMLIIAVVFVGAGMVGYLMQINQISEKGLLIKKMERNLTQLREENDKLAIKLVENQSMVELSEKVASLGMVEGSEIIYLNSAVSVARK